MDIVSKISEYGILPVICIDHPKYAVPLAKALKEGGVPQIEVTIRNETALESIKSIKEYLPDMIVGAGTITSCDGVDRALEVGADFLVSPGYGYKVVDYCIEKEVEIIPGCSTATEIDYAIQKGLRTFKFFPAEQLGGIDTIRMFSGPFSDIRFIPTGGISYKLLPEYLGNNAVAACGGSFMASKEDIENENYRKITDACIRAIDISLGFELAHVGIHHESEEELRCTVSRFASLFRLPLRKSHSAVFAGEAIECVDGLRFDANRHIGFYTRSANRAIAYFRRMGVPINLASIRKDSNGTITSFYLEEILMGFAIHVIQK